MNECPTPLCQCMFCCNEKQKSPPILKNAEPMSLCCALNASDKTNSTNPPDFFRLSGVVGPYICSFPVSLMLILLRAALKLDILLPVVAVVLVLVADKGDIGEIGDSARSLVGVRATDSSFSFLSILSFLLATRTISSYVTAVEIGWGGGLCGGGGTANSEVSSIASWPISCGASHSGSPRMLRFDGDVARGICSCEVDDRNAWFILGVLRLFIRLNVLATPLNILVGVLGVFGRSSSCSASLGSWSTSSEYTLPLA